MLDYKYMKDQIVFPNFTLKGEITRLGIKVTFEDIKYKRGCGNILKHGEIQFCSISSPEIAYPHFYLPGTYIREKEEVLIHPLLWEYLKNPKKELPETVVYDNQYFSLDAARYRGEALSSCKEEALSICMDNSYQGIIISGFFDDEFFVTMKSFQKNFADPAIITSIPGGIKLKWPSSWLTFFDLGWLFLAVRIAQGREELDKPHLKHSFFEYTKGGMVPPSGMNFTYNKNWRYYFS